MRIRSVAGTALLALGLIAAREVPSGVPGVRVTIEDEGWPAATRRSAS